MRLHARRPLRPVHRSERDAREHHVGLSGQFAEESLRLVEVARLAIDAVVEPHDCIRRQDRPPHRFGRVALLRDRIHRRAQLRAGVLRDGAHGVVRNRNLGGLGLHDLEIDAQVTQYLGPPRRAGGKNQRLHRSTPE